MLCATETPAAHAAARIGNLGAGNKPAVEGLSERRESWQRADREHVHGGWEAAVERQAARMGVLLRVERGLWRAG